MHSNDYYWRKKRILVPELDPESVTDLWISTLHGTALQDVVGRLNMSYSDGQKQKPGQVKKDGTTVTHCGALNLTGSQMFLTENNITCPEQTQKDEHGVERYWPATELGRYSRTLTYHHFCLLFDGLYSDE
jgi:hypothetical protein